MQDPEQEAMAAMMPQGGEMPVIDDEEAMLVDGDSANFHALDVPEDWRDADPYAMSNEVGFGTGYEDIIGQAMPGITPPAAPGATDVQALRDAMLQSMTADNAKSAQYQDANVEDNTQLIRSMKRRV